MTCASSNAGSGSTAAAGAASAGRLRVSLRVVYVPPRSGGAALAHIEAQRPRVRNDRPARVRRRERIVVPHGARLLDSPVFLRSPFLPPGVRSMLKYLRMGNKRIKLIWWILVVVTIFTF